MVSTNKQPVFASQRSNQPKPMSLSGPGLRLDDRWFLHVLSSYFHIMKCMVISYIKSEALMDELEGILEYRKFSVIESNNCYRVFLGDVPERILHLAESLNKELANAVFDIEDSMFIVYPLKKPGGIASFSNIIIKRKGNRHLRAGSLFK